MGEPDPKCWACCGTGKKNGVGCECRHPRCIHNACPCTREPLIVGRRVITPPGAAIKVTELLLSPAAEAGLRTNRESLGAVK